MHLISPNPAKPSSSFVCSDTMTANTRIEGAGRSSRLLQSAALRARSGSILQKFLAQGAAWTEDRSAMSTFARSTNHRHAIVAVVSAAFLWALALSASPQLHQRVHPDAGRADHSCAVTMIASGNYNHSVHVPVISAPTPAVQFSKIPVLNPLWVPSPFLSARIFEHAPPTRS